MAANFPPRSPDFIGGEGQLIGAVQDRNNSLRMNDYMPSDSRNQHLHSSQPPLRPDSLPRPAMPAYPNFTMPFQNSPKDTSGFEGSIDSRMASPMDRTGAFNIPQQGPVYDLSSGPQNTMASTGEHRTSNSSGAATRNRNGSGDESGTASPESARGQGWQSSLDGYGGDDIQGSDGIGHFMEGGSEMESKGRDDKGDAPPPWSDLKTKAGKERKRLPLACIACRRKKIRCSGEKPACKHCLRSRIPCVYKVTTRKAAPRTDYMAMLDKRMKRMEERVIKTIPKDDLRDISSVGRAVVKPDSPGGQTKSAGNRKRSAQEAFGTELDDWANSGIQIQGDSTPKRPPGQPRVQESEENKLLTEGAESLPSKEVQEHLAEVFFEFVYGQSYLLLHKPSFMRRLRAGTVPPVLILAVCAVSARFSTHPLVNSEPAFLRGEEWAKVAREISLKRYDVPNITILTVYLILGLHEFGTCQGGRSWMLGGMAQRMAYALQLHRDLMHDPLARRHGQEGELSFTDREIRRRVMWACFMMDRFNSSGTERPIFVNEQWLKLQLPIKEHYFQMEIPGPTEMLQGDVPNTVSPDTGQMSDPHENMGVAAYVVRIVAIWGLLIRYLNLGGKENDPHPLWSPESTFTELKGKVEKFANSLPESLRYNADNLHTHASQRLAKQYLFMHITYNQVVLFLNRFAIPAAPGSRLPTDMPAQYLSDAGRAAIDAANQVSSLISVATDHQVVAPFVGYCAFASSTVHIFGVFSKNAQLEESSKRNLAYNVKYLGRMKKYWGMFHFLAESLKDIYRQHADAALKGSNEGSKCTSIFQYGDWFDRYPHGVSRTDYEDPASQSKKELDDAILSQKSDLQSVEEFFASLSPTSKCEHVKKPGKKRTSKSAATSKDRKEQQQPQQHQQHQHQLSQQTESENRSAKEQLQQSQQPQQMMQQQQQPPSQMPMMVSDQQQPQTRVRAPFPAPLSYPQNQPPQPQQQPFPTPYNPQQQAPDLHILPPQQPHPQSNMPFTPFTPVDPSPDHSRQNNPFWDLDMYNVPGGGAYMSEPTNPWFMPFNMEPPDVGIGAGGRSDDGIGVPGMDGMGFGLLDVPWSGFGLGQNARRGGGDGHEGE
ncbi:MAG: hypothetical protein M1819_006170 [Sarea resinae]|nr:MAG: hypothetical protein M1819_006170 [Sarea resinae]